ncbi:MAG: glycoside hydrolase family 88 protein [Cytophagales bacterium]|nr:glycoside hydrolase family 88 protein [Cytophagales bacterium]MDW8383947.1 glycoside hydrolase family 88 protein [Flammeovirgaceae bacterium]
MKKLVTLVSLMICMWSCDSQKENTQDKFTCVDVEKQIRYCEKQLRKSVENLDPQQKKLPRNIEHGEATWSCSHWSGWTAGFYPGILWYMYEATNDNYWKEKATEWTLVLDSNKCRDWKDHDLGFVMYCSYGNAYRLTKDTSWLSPIYMAADTLMTLFNPQVGTILSWPWMKRKKGWPHNTIIDNMMNLEMLMFVAQMKNDERYRQVAIQHANMTKQHHFRDDFTTYHVIVYDSARPVPLQKVTFQGYADNSMWARGQAWAIYGFTMMYRFTKQKEYLVQAQKAADVYLERLPEDYIPYWDFMAPNIPHEERDASAAAITASALIELADHSEEPLRQKYFQSSQKMLATLSSEEYLADDKNHAFLLHSVGFKPAGGEIDMPIIYADYYYLEALLRTKQFKEKYPNSCM